MPMARVQGQNTSAISAPGMGFVFDPGTRALRPIAGIPGASLLGAPLEGGIPVMAAAVSPGQDYALVLTGSERQVNLLRLQNGSAALREMSLAPNPDRILLSPAGSAAAFYYAATGELEVITGLPDRPAKQGKIDVSSLVRLSSPLAIHDDGRLILIGQSDAAGGVMLLDAAAGPTALSIAGPVSAMAFRSRSDDAVIANQDGRISLVRGLSTQPTYEILADAAGGLAGAIAVEFSGERVYAVSAEGTVMGLGIADKTPVVLSCHCNASGLHRLKGGAVFRLNESLERPLMLLDTSASQERVLFVPQAETVTAAAAQDSARSIQ